MKSGGNKYVLPSKKSEKPVFSRSAWKRFKKMANIESNSPKSYRSTFVSYTLGWEIPIAVLSHFTGHSLQVIQNHYYSYVESMKGDTLEQVMGLDSLMKEILAGYSGTGESSNLKLTRWA